MITIAHIADIHIGSSPVRSAEYRLVFDLFKESLIGNKVDVVVIAGDIFHKKTVFSGSDVSDFKYLLRCIPEGTDVIVIPGNHDSNLNDHEACDLIEPVISPIESPHLIWSKYTETLVVRGVKFLHVSVFDESPTSTLAEKYIAEAPDTILLYHGFIAGAVFGKHTVRDKESRITTALGNEFRAVLAGDIHGMQVFGAHGHIAYPGSMIQQNIAEDTNKGYLLWEFNTGTRPQPPKFIPLVNTSAMIKLDVRGKTITEIEEMLAAQTRPDNLLKVALYTDAEDSSEQQRKVVEKFGRIDKINFIGGATQAPNENEEIEDTLTDLLIAAGIDVDAVEEIIIGYKERMTIDNRRWYVKTLEFDNMFKYGAGNHIDFTKLNGISGVVANNRAGKSSIIDVLVYTLFNKLLRGDKGSIINFTKTNARAVVTFVVVPDEYVIEKTLDKIGHVKVRLLKNGVNITNASIIDTYKTVTALIGNIDQFCMTGLFYNDNHNIVTLKSTERMKLLPQLIGLADEQILADTKVKIKNLKQSIAGIPKGDPNAETLLTAAIAGYNTAAENLKIAETRLTTATTFKDFLYHDAAAYENEITKTQAEKEALTAEINSIIPPAVPVESATPCILSDEEHAELELISVNAPDGPAPTLPEARGYPVDDITTIKVLAAKTPRPQTIEKLTNAYTKADLDAVVKTIMRLETAIETSSNITIAPSLTTKYTKEEVSAVTPALQNSIQNDIITSISTIKILKQNLMDQGPTPPVPELKSEVVSLKADLERKLNNIDVALYEKQLEDLTARSLNEQTALARALSLYNSRSEHLQQQIAAAQSKTRLAFAIDCAACTSNSRVLANDLADLLEAQREHHAKPPPVLSADTSTLVTEQQAKLTLAREHVTTLTAAIAKIEKHIEDHKTGLTAATTHTARVNSIRLQIESETSKLDVLTHRLENITLMLSVAQWYASEESNRLLSEAKSQQAIIEASLAQQEEYARVITENNLIMEAAIKLENHIAYTAYMEEMETYRLITKLIKAKSRLAENLLYKDYLKTQRIKSLKTQIDNSAAKLARLISERDMISTVLSVPNIITAHTEVNNAQRAIGAASIALATAQENMAIRHQYMSTGLPLDTQLINLEKYKECLTNGTFRGAIVAKVLEKIINSINTNLRLITDFTILHIIDGDRIELLIIEGIRKLPIEMASGFQRFIISLMFRIAVTMNRCEFLIIDEGFGCLDEANMRSVIEFFSTITHCYRFLFVISHVSEMHAALTTPLVIKNNDSDSYICNRSEDPATITLPDGKIHCGCGSIHAAASHKGHTNTRKHMEWEASL